MSGADGVFELRDRPKLRRGLLGGISIATGASLIFVAWWNCRVCGTMGTGEWIALVIGICATVGGIAAFLIPTGEPKVFLRADNSGLRFLDGLPMDKGTTYLSLPWHRIRDIQIVDLGGEAGYGIEITSSFSERELADLREKYGPSYVGSAHSTKHTVPVLGWRKKANETLAGIRSIAALHLDMSNFTVEEDAPKAARLSP